MSFSFKDYKYAKYSVEYPDKNSKKKNENPSLKHYLAAEKRCKQQTKKKRNRLAVAFYLEEKEAEEKEEEEKEKIQEKTPQKKAHQKEKQVK